MIQTQLNSNKLLTTVTIHANAGGKAILIGEHSVVYGFKAVALALPDVRLKMTLSTDDSVTSWETAWETEIKGKNFQTNSNIQLLLKKAFATALQLCHPSLDLAQYSPQKIRIQSEIPLGGGMGGSAAISTCFVKLAAAIAKQKNLIANEISSEQQIHFANEVDCIFHSGKASGLDVTTVACDGMIEFLKDKGFHYLKNAKEFWLALVDSKERGETAAMVKKVADFLKMNPLEGQQYLDNLGQLAEKTVTFLQEGLLTELAGALNSSQVFLEKLGVSTPKMKEIIDTLQTQGAIAAKITGAGGGGLVLAIFEKKPNHLYSMYTKDILYITKVPVYEQS